MKRLVQIVVIALCASCKCADGDSLNVPHVEDGFRWPDVKTVAEFRDTAVSDNEVAVKSVWTVDSLYFLFSVLDSDLRCRQMETDHPKLYLDDMVEFLIDTRNDHGELWLEDDIIYHINLFGYKKDDRGTPEGVSNPKWNGSARYAIYVHGTINDSSDIDEGYEVEVALPWTEIGVTPDRGLVLGVDFAGGDDDGTGRQLFDLAGASPFRSPSAFRRLVLS